MFRKGIFLAACVLGMTVSARSDDANSKTQRVSPEVLKEALELEKAREAGPVLPAPVSLEELSQLAVKLKSRGDLISAELIERYVRQQKPENELAPPHPVAEEAATLDRIWISIEAFEVNGDETLKESIWESYPEVQEMTRIREELNRMVEAKKATVVLPLDNLSGELNESIKFGETTGEVEILLPGPNGTTSVERRVAEITAEVKVKLKSNGKFEVNQIIERSQIDEENSITLQGKAVPGLTKTKIQSTNETIAGRTVLLKGLRGLFVFTSVDFAPSKVGLEHPDVEK